MLTICLQLNHNFKKERKWFGIYAISNALECFPVCGLSPEYFLLMCPDGLP